MSKYILIIDNNDLTQNFSNMVLNCIKDHIGVYNMVGVGLIQMTICNSIKNLIRYKKETRESLFFNIFIYIYSKSVSNLSNSGTVAAFIHNASKSLNTSSLNDPSGQATPAHIFSLL